MKSSRFLSLLAAAALVCAAACDYAATAVVSAYRAGKSWLIGHAEIALQAFDKPEVLAMPKIKFVAAMAYVMRQAKRERPTVTPRWRMCPSA